MPSRREFVTSLVQTMCAMSALDLLLSRGAVARSVTAELHRWLGQVNEVCSDLRQGGLTTQQWRVQMETLFSHVSLQEVLAAIDFEQLASTVKAPEVGFNSEAMRFPPVLDTPVMFKNRIFALRQGRAIGPHGHRNMQSCHLVLGGSFRLIQYDRVQDLRAADALEPTAVIIRPAGDHIVETGTASAISDTEHNVHWLQARTDRAWTLDFLMAHHTSDYRHSYIRDNLDIHRGVSVGKDLLQVPIITAEEGLKLYGRVS